MEEDPFCKPVVSTAEISMAYSASTSHDKTDILIKGNDMSVKFNGISLNSKMMSEEEAVTTPDDTLNETPTQDSIIEATESQTSPPSSQRSISPTPYEHNLTYVQKYAKDPVGCGYLRMSCDAIDRYLKYGKYGLFKEPTKRAIDIKFEKLLDQSFGMSILEIMAGKYNNGLKYAHLDGLRRAREAAWAERVSDEALEVWETFRNRTPERSVSRSSSISSLSSLSGVSTVSDFHEVTNSCILAPI